MKAIRRLTIENFQSHSKTIIQPAPNSELTVITGPSDSGKTAIIRAMKWLWHNSPQGDSFIRVGCTFARVAVELANGWTVVRERTRSLNRYITIDPDNDRQKYEGFGNDVPLEVQELLGVRPVQVGDMDLKLNLAEQLDGPFLGSSVSAGSRAKVLGKLAGTEEIDVANKSLGTDIYRANQEEKALNVQAEVLAEKIEALNWVLPLGVKIAKLEVLVEKIKANQARLKSLQEAQRRLSEVGDSITKVYVCLAKFQGVEEAAGLLAETQKDSGTHFNLVKSLEQKNQLSSQIHEIRNRLQLLFCVGMAQDYLQEAEKGQKRKDSLVSLRSKNTHVSRDKVRVLELIAKLAKADEAHSCVSWAKHHHGYLTKTLSLNQRKKSLSQQIDIQIQLRDSLSPGTETTGTLNRTLEALTRLQLLTRTRASLQGIRHATEATKGQEELAQHTLTQVRDLYTRTMKESGFCPTCGAQTEQFHLEEVV